MQLNAKEATVRDLSNRLDSYLTQTLLPRLVPLLGSGWQSQGTALTDPEGRDFLVRFVFYTRQLIFQPACDEACEVDELPGIALDLFVPPETLAEAIKTKLLPQCTSQGTDGGGDPPVAATRDSVSKAAAVPTTEAL